MSRKTLITIIIYEMRRPPEKNMCVPGEFLISYKVDTNSYIRLDVKDYIRSIFYFCLNLGVIDIVSTVG